MPGKIENWPELERMFVVDGKSHRQIALFAGTSNSTISAKAKRDDWEGKKIAYQQALARRGYETAAATVHHENEAVQRESILVARAYIRRFAGQITDPSFKANAKDALEMMKFLAEQIPTGEGAPKGGTKVIEGTAVAVEGSGPEFLRRVVELARSRVADSGSVGSDPMGEPPGARPN